DSGLEVAALGGMPGIHSARFTPTECVGVTPPGAAPGARGAPGDAHRRSLFLNALRGKPRPWLARFHCTLAIALPGGEMFFSQGEVEGEIIPQERGQGGFGYDPIFLISDLGSTMAQLAPEKKNRISHRARALQAALPQLRQLLRAEEK
ncbi:MAG: non-canonical purine NTP pyrophosphatase, partial [Anaerolineaceae bacterium]|nr:non-canonical purine NTP pyrophosphatase [Anaerolineaceae bacterium]